MKNLVFGIIAVVLLSINMYSQENYKNQYDYIGKIHNEVILEFIKQNNTTNMSIGDVLSKVEPIILNNQTYKSKFGNTYKNTTESQIKQYMPDVENNFKKVVLDQKISNGAKTLLIELLDNVGSSSEYSAIYSDVIVFENKVLQSDLVLEEKKIVLSASSIARYSSYLWLVKNPRTTISTNSKRWFWIVLADMAGGILGSGGGLAGTVVVASAASLIAEQVSSKP